jgi:PAS domain S-box-containing protein
VFPGELTTAFFADGEGHRRAVAIIRDITERRAAEAELQRSHQKINQILTSIQDDVYVLDRDWRFVYANPRYSSRIGKAPKDFIGHSIWELFPRHLGTIVEENFRAAMDRREIRRFEMPGRYSEAWYGMTVFPSTEGITVLRTDLTARKRTEDALQRTLAEKDRALATNQALLREVHHRVKNNLQMLCDLMYLQMEAMPDREQHHDLEDAYSRIYAIARLHEQLYQSMHSGKVPVREYLTRLVDGFRNLYPLVSVTLEAASDGAALDIDRAIHVGLIVNELVMNAVKHAFPSGHQGHVALVIREAGEQVLLQVRDNGRGLPPEVKLEQAKSVGLRTVYILARRLEASLAVTTNGGTCFTLTFPAEADPPVEPGDPQVEAGST